MHHALEFETRPFGNGNGNGIDGDALTCVCR